MSIEQIKKWFETAVPNPTKDTQRMQLAVHFEEMGEMFDGIDDASKERFKHVQFVLNTLSDTLKSNPQFKSTVTDRDALLDALCDVIVTSVGLGHSYGFDIIGAIGEVANSNDSKFVDGKPVFNEQGKIAKGPNYKKPNLTPFLGKDPTE